MSGTLLFLLWIWAVLDVIATDTILVRNLPKTTWLFLVIILPSVGGVAWLLLGRPEGAGFSLGGQRSSLYVDPDDRWAPAHGSPRRFTGPDDDPSFTGSGRTGSNRSLPASLRDDEPLAIRERKLLEKEAELAKREAALGQAGESPTTAGHHQPNEQDEPGEPDDETKNDSE